MKNAFSAALLRPLFLLVFGFVLSACDAAAPSAPGPRVLIISVDGLRPDLALRADAPNIRGLMARGSYSFWASTTDVAITLPSHVSMLTGVTPRRHGIEYNAKEAAVVYPKVPTLLELARKNGLTTAMAAGKDKFNVFARPGALDWSYYPADGLVTNDEVTSQALAILKAHQPQVFFVHYPEVDSVGHKIGWGTPEQIAAIQSADAGIGRLLGELKNLGLLDKTVVIISADHGGAGKSHGAGDPRSRHIPWIIAGPGIRKGVDLTTVQELVIHTEDTFATACKILGIPLEPGLDGKPVDPAFEGWTTTPAP
jgi:predicted AlkP superfamily pyrophosphatase or phosphodiesterase